MSFELTILGSNSAIPIGNRFPTSQIVDFDQHLYMVDCGEGTQIQVRKNKIKIQRIKAIFISHLHGDHYFGLFGLLGTMNLLGRQMPLKIFATKGLDEIIELQKKLANTSYDFDIEFTPINHKESYLLYEDEFMSVTTIPLRHRIPTSVFLFQQKEGKRRLLKDKIEFLQIPITAMNSIKNGGDFEDENGVIHKNKDITRDPHRVYSYAYCSDTKYYEKVIPIIQNVDVLYHEATFLESEKKRAQQTMHSTATQAATIAKKAEVGELILGHYSARYKDLRNHVIEASEVFPKCKLAIEGERFYFP